MKWSFDDIKALRPKEATSAGIGAAISNACAALAAALRCAAEIDAARSKGLLTATDAELLKLEADAAAAHLAAGRIEALIIEMRNSLRGAALREARQARLARIVRANKSGAEFAAAWRERYAPAAAVIADLLRLEVVHLEDLAQAGGAAPDDAADGVPEIAAVHAELFGHWGRIMGAAIQLPSEGGELVREVACWVPVAPAMRQWNDGVGPICWGDDPAATAQMQPMAAAAPPGAVAAIERGQDGAGIRRVG